MKIFPILMILGVTASYAHGQSLSAQKTLTYKQTVKKVEAYLKERNLTTFAVIDHKKAAAKAKLSMPKAVVYVFGNPMAGTPLMVDNPTWALHLPLKVAVYEDKEGTVSIAVPDLKAIAAQDKLSPAAAETSARMIGLLNGLLDIK